MQAGYPTDRDLVIQVIADGRDPAAVTLRVVLTRHPATVGPDDRVTRVAELMRKHAVRHVPVADQGVPVGLVSIGDLVDGRVSMAAEGSLVVALDGQA